MALPNRHSPEVHTSMGAKQICDRCQVEMIERPGFPGLFVCPRDPGHTRDTEPAPDEGASARRLYLAQSVSLEPRATEFNRQRPYYKTLMEQMGLTGPISRPRQASNQRDGSYCLPLGEIAGGGSKSSGRKKPKKGNKTYVDTPWTAEGATNKK